MLHYNFLNNQLMNSDAGETTSTDSDIGTSPSGTTLASPPSSPQQLLQQQQHQNYSMYTNNQNNNNNNNNNSSNYDLPFNEINSSPLSSQSSTATINNNNNVNNNPNSVKSNQSKTSMNKQANSSSLTSSIVRQHSYLNAVQLNDYKQSYSSQQQPQGKQPHFSKSQAFKQQSENIPKNK